MPRSSSIEELKEFRATFDALFLLLADSIGVTRLADWLADRLSKRRG